MTIFILIFFCLFLVYSLLIDYYRRSWKQVPDYITSDHSAVKISVVIAARNEEENIQALISMLEIQDYAKKHFEVIIVDDHSSDKTWKLLTEMQHEGISLQTLQLPAGVVGKKKAIEMGVLSARGELIVTTDADCRLPPTWLSSFASYYVETGAKFIASPVKMEGSDSLLSIFQTVDFLILQAITGASVHKKFHMMCNGANLSYSRQAFLDVDGFEGVDNIPSGDDMLLMHKIFTRYPRDVYYMKCRGAVVSTRPEASWKAFIHQRIRWSSKAVHFTDRKVFYVLLLTYCVNVGLLVLAIASIVKAYWLLFFLLFLLAKILIEFPFVNAAAAFFSQQRLVRFFPLLQPMHIIYTIIAGWLGRFGSYEWKSRIIKNKGKENLAKQ